MFQYKLQERKAPKTFKIQINLAVKSCVCELCHCEAAVADNDVDKCYILSQLTEV